MGKMAVLEGAKAMALTALDLATSSALRDSIRDEFNRAQ
jgi:hypothetical protein